MMIITIDGPAASGKSSVARRMAQELGIYYLYTGLLYRAAAYVFAEHFNQHDGNGCFGLFKVDGTALELIKDIEYFYQNGSAHIRYRGELITDKLYRHHIDQLASMVSANAQVREALLDVQRSVAMKYDLVADGRDCGTVVFPTADIKFFLTARVEVRAQRLLNDIERCGEHLTLDQMVDQLNQRDSRDANRAVAPLKIPDDAIMIDNSDMSLDETEALFLERINERCLIK